MKKLFLFFILFLTFLNAEVINQCLKISKNDYKNYLFKLPSNNFFVFDEKINSNISVLTIFKSLNPSILTKKSNEDFNLYIIFKPNDKCPSLLNVSNLEYQAVNYINNKENNITEIKKLPIQLINKITLNLKTSKNTKIKIYYTCMLPTGLTGLDQESKLLTYNTTSYINYSTDNFAVIPNLKLTLISQSKNYINFRYDTFDEKYSQRITKEDNLKIVSPETGYLINYYDGFGTGRAIIYQKFKNPLMLLDDKIGLIDEDDTDYNCRIMKDEKDINMNNTSKFWGGIGTNETENNPENNTINTDVTQHGNKDLRYNNLSW